MYSTHDRPRREYFLHTTALLLQFNLPLKHVCILPRGHDHWLWIAALQWTLGQILALLLIPNVQTWIAVALSPSICRFAYLKLHQPAIRWLQIGKLNFQCAVNLYWTSVFLDNCSLSLVYDFPRLSFMITHMSSLWINLVFQHRLWYLLWNPIVINFLQGGAMFRFLNYFRILQVLFV